MELTLIIVWYFQFTFFAFLFAWHTDSIKKKLDNIIWNTRPPLPDPPPSDILPPEEIDASLPYTRYYRYQRQVLISRGLLLALFLQAYQYTHLFFAALSISYFSSNALFIRSRLS